MLNITSKKYFSKTNQFKGSFFRLKSFQNYSLAAVINWNAAQNQLSNLIFLYKNYSQDWTNNLFSYNYLQKEMKYFLFLVGECNNNSKKFQDANNIIDHLLDGNFNLSDLDPDTYNGLLLLIHCSISPCQYATKCLTRFDFLYYLALNDIKISNQFLVTFKPVITYDLSLTIFSLLKISSKFLKLIVALAEAELIPAELFQSKFHIKYLAQMELVEKEQLHYFLTILSKIPDDLLEIWKSEFELLLKKMTKLHYDASIFAQHQANFSEKLFKMIMKSINN